MNRLMETMEYLNIENRSEKVKKLEEYMERILRLNESINLTAIRDREEFVQKHYVDSLLCAASKEFRSGGRVIDVGTGAGFPGVPLAVAFPQKKFVLLDSLNKRVKIVNELCENLEILNVRALHGRAEEVARQKDMRDTFDVCVSRAVSNMSTLCEYCLPFVREGGSFIAFKGPECDEEIKSALKAVSVLGGRLIRHEGAADINVKNFDLAHRLIYIKKIGMTPSKYPRKAGTPSKEPIL